MVIHSDWQRVIIESQYGCEKAKVFGSLLDISVLLKRVLINYF